MNAARLVAMALLLLAGPAQAQDARHDRGHELYKEWASKRTANCCNDTDCRDLDADEWQKDAAGYRIRIGQAWCPVEAAHFLIKGRSPDISRAHACIWPSGIQTCDRLLCFDPPAKF